MKRIGSLYLQVMEEMRAQILSGEYPIGSKLPNEYVLSETFDVSRVTMRKAIAGLVDDGLVEKVRGVGTFVRKPRKIRQIFRSSVVKGFSQMAKTQGYEVETKVLKMERRDITGSKLGKALKMGQALFISRLRSIAGEPVVVENNYFPLPEYDFLTEEDLTKSLYQLIDQKKGINGLSADDIVISMDNADKEKADLLSCSVGFPLFSLKTAVKDKNGDLVHFGAQYIVSDRYELHV